MKTKYNKTSWVDNKTQINAEKLNNIENGISNLYENTLSVSEFLEGPGIEIGHSESGLSIAVQFNRVDNIPENNTSEGNVGDYCIDEINGFLYFCLQNDPEHVKWVKIKLEDF